MRKRTWAIGLGICLAASTAVVANTLWFRPWSIRVFFDRVAYTDLLDSPEMLSSLRLLEPWGLRGHNARLDDVSDAHAEAGFKQARADLDTLLGYDRAKLAEDDQLSYDTLRFQLEQELAGARFRYHDYPVNQLQGAQIGLVNLLLYTHPLKDATDAEHYLARLAAVPAKLGQLREAMAERARRGIVAPHFALAKSAEGMRDFTAMPAERNPLYLVFVEKLQQAGLAEPERNRLAAAARDAVERQVYPAYRALQAATEALAQAHPRDDGVWALPDGAAYYAYKLKQHTTTQLSPDQVHDLGLREVGRIQAEMRKILAERGEPDAEHVGRAMKRLGDDPRFLYSDDAAGRAQIVADYKAILAQAQAALPQAFDQLPTAALDVKPVPAMSEKTAPGAYYESPATDGSRPGVFFANLYDIKGSPRWSMRTLAYHEGVPGHHLQSALALEQRDLPLFRRTHWYTAYGEGWALYAERLAWEMGLEPDPYDQLGRLRDELFRAVRLVVDTGMHARRWSREQAVAYMEENTGMTRGDTVIEIERYLVDPGQACAYKIGMLKLLELRERARGQLGAQFDLRRFHDRVLSSGGLPLDLLERRIDDWIAAGGA
ncbi:DUF885 domain-containing protein [Chitinimonas koreensis]|uniref:DUF885 domain-containing protein n=1 Tax=Chitinimonas koreensis TaxID=356302 RepID=UPI0004188A20|nr:DUF885 domain-containing protein [Chitinimonas koreensis]